MAKIGNIPLKDHEAFNKPIKDAHVVHKVHYKPLEGTRSIHLSKSQREELKARRESLRELDSLSRSSREKPRVKSTVSSTIKVDVIPKLCKRGLMQYINQHSIQHLNPSEVKKMDKKVLVDIAQNLEHIK